MNSAAAETIPRKWTIARWLMLVALVFVAHVALIFLFGAKDKIIPRPGKNIRLEIANAPGEWLALEDPTLFVLPHMKNLPPDAALQLAGIKLPSFRWTEEPRWLGISAGNLGATFSRFMQTNQFAAIELNFKPSPIFSELNFSIEPAFAKTSTMQIEGDLARRKLLNKIDLPSLNYDDVLAPSKVQVLVDANGYVTSAVLLPPENNLATANRADIADATALAKAQTLRFAPSSNVTIGQIIFNWRTIPNPPTNAPDGS